MLYIYQTYNCSYNIRSSDDISSGYSSAEPIAGGLSRTSSMTNASKSRLKAKRSEVSEMARHYINFQYFFKVVNFQNYFRCKSETKH